MLNISNIIKNKHIALLDGAIATELYNKGVFINKLFEEANLSSPDLVFEVHKEYAQAGAQIITSNTWAANYFKLKEYNLEHKFLDINKKAMLIAKMLDMPVIGSIGPTGKKINLSDNNQIKKSFYDQAKILIQNKCDGIILETFHDHDEMKLAISAIKSVDNKIPIFAQMVIEKQGAGSEIYQIANLLQKNEADIVGFNCFIGPSAMLDIVKKTKNIIKKPMIVQPNAGLPKIIDGRHIYLASPEYFANYTKYFLKLGVQFIGGCCGSTPRHIKAMANTFRFYSSFSKNNKDITNKVEKTKIKIQEKKILSKFLEKINKKEKVISVELLPPIGHDISGILQKAKKLKENVDINAINIPNGPRASARLNAMITSMMIQKEIGIEAILHYTCRDQNLIGMQADLLGAHLLKVHNILAITGDPPKIGNYKDITGVFDTDAIGLVKLLKNLNYGVDIAGRDIGDETSFSIGIGVNPGSDNFEYEMDRFQKKIDMGADWAITQPVFDKKTFLKFIEYKEKKNIKLPIIAGIWPLVSYKNAVFMNNEVPGISVPNNILEKMSKTKNTQDAVKIGSNIAIEMYSDISKLIQGIQISAPFGKVDIVISILKTIV